ncbi:signal peptidase II [Candidatus Woesearchaeota archaeon]|nr:signal peptidase II [Candidatus Woesearchaeota archaeon]
MVEREKSLISFFSGVAMLIVLFDQLTKYFIYLRMPDWSLGFFSVHLVKNTGAGFGILQEKTFVLGVISLLVSLAVIFYYKKIPPQKLPQFLFALFLGGVVGNLIDRFARGYVIDFLDFTFWPAFNIADASITVGMIGIIFYFLNEEKEAKMKKEIK